MIRTTCRGLRHATTALVLGVTFGLLPVMAQESEEEAAGNNLSFPVIWAEGATKSLRGTAGMSPLLAGQWWYWWGTEGVEPDVVPLSCLPDPDNLFRCDDASPQSALGELAGEGTPGRRVHMAWLQCTHTIRKETSTVPIRKPLKSGAPSFNLISGTGKSTVVASNASTPAMSSKMGRISAAERPNTPTTSRDEP